MTTREKYRAAREFSAGAYASDTARDAGLQVPDDVVCYYDIPYGPYGDENLLDVYMPKNAHETLPVILNIHGGGYVYGTKEVYQFYCMHLAQQGFAVVNMNYRLAPRHKYPAPLRDAARALRWMDEASSELGFDMNNVFFVGDSAGGQLASQLTAAWANESYAMRLGVRLPSMRLAAVGLNCGMYDPLEAVTDDGDMISLYFGTEPLLFCGPTVKVLRYIDGAYPPTYLLSASHDFLREACRPMAEFLQAKGVEVQWKIYGAEDDETAQHVFHVNMRHPLAEQANSDEIAFFRKHVR